MLHAARQPGDATPESVCGRLYSTMNEYDFERRAGLWPCGTQRQHAPPRARGGHAGR
jgi:hypothetical protein